MRLLRVEDQFAYRIVPLASVGLLWASMLTGSAGCRHRDFASLGTVTSVNIVGQNRLPLRTKITNPQNVPVLVDFVDSQRTGWNTPGAGVPVPVVIAEFYEGNTFKGHFGVGKNFFETQRDGRFFSKDASPEDLRHFLELAGVEQKSVDR
jgi:hypothetical protein